MIRRGGLNLGWTDYFLYAVTDPRELYRRIKQKDPDPLPLSFIVPAIVALTDILVVSLMGKENGFFYYKLSYGWIFLFIYAVLKVVIYSALVDTAAQFLGHRGNIREVITLLNFSQFPKVFILAGIYVFVITDFAPGFFYVLLSICFIIWYVVIIMQGLSEMHSIEPGRSFMILILPAFFLGIITLLLLILFILAAAGFIAT